MTQVSQTYSGRRGYEAADHAAISVRDKRADLRKNALKGAKLNDSAVEDVDLDSLCFEFMPVSFDIYGAAEPDTLQTIVYLY